MANHLGTRRRTVRRTHQPPHQISVISSTGSGRNYVSTRRVYQTPSTTQIEDETQSRNISLPSIGGGKISGPSGNAGTVVLIGLLLFFSVTYDDFWKPFFSTLTGGLQGAPLQTKMDGRMVLGGILFIAIAGFIASTSPEAGGVVILFMIGLWLVYITLGQGGTQLNKFFGWFQQPSVAGASGNFGSPTAAIPPTLPKSGAGTTKQ